MARRKRRKADPDSAPRAGGRGHAARATQRGGAPFLPRLIPIAPVALAVLVSANSLLNRFASDDQQQVLSNAFIRDFRNLPLAFLTTVWSYVTEDIAMTMQPYFRPMFSALLTASYAIFGEAAWGWHLVNVLIHAAVTFFVFLVAREVTSRRVASALTAGFFAVHPVHAESVAWISGVTDPLMALFFLPAYLAYSRHRRSGGKYLLPASLFLYFLALLSKETALALPILVAYVEVSRGNRTLRATAGTVVLFAVPTALYFVMRYYVMGGMLFGAAGARYPQSYAVLTAPLVTLKYLVLLVFPAGYSYQHYTAFVTTMKSVAFLGPVAILAMLSAAVAALRSKELTFAAVWFIATLLPALAGLRHFDQEYLVQERYLYLPSIGFCLAGALGVEYVAKTSVWRIPGKAGAGLACAALLLVWGGVHIKQNRIWHDSVTLFEHCVKTDPDLATARTALSGVLFNVGKLNEADSAARAAIESDPTCANAYLNLSFFAHRSGKLNEAIAELERATTAVPTNEINRTILATVYLNLGLLYSQRNEADRADGALNRSMELWPRPTAWYYAAQFYFDQGRFEESRELFERAALVVPRRYAQIHLNLARVYERLGQPDQARAAYERYLAYAPLNARDRSEAARRLSQL